MPTFGLARKAMLATKSPSYSFRIAERPTYALTDSTSHRRALVQRSIFT